MGFTLLMIFLVLLGVGLLVGLGVVIYRAVGTNSNTNELKARIADLEVDNDIYQDALGEILINPENSAFIANGALVEARKNNRLTKGGK